MGKTSKWFRTLFGSKRSSSDSPQGSDSPPDKDNKSSKLGIVRSFNGNGGTRGLPPAAASSSSSSSSYVEAMDANKHAIAVAAATAAVAEAALAAAQAAAAVVKMTSGAAGGVSRAAAADRHRREFAAVKIQSAFRACLARRALRALKGLVKLQAWVRGHIVRKQSADMLRRMQAMARIQARACANRACVSESSDYRSNSKFHRLRSGPKSSIKNNASLERRHLDSNWFDHWMKESSQNSHRDISVKNQYADDEKDDKILEIDTWNPPLKSSCSNQAFRALKNVPGWIYNQQALSACDSLSRHSTQSQNPNPGLSSGEVSLRTLKSPLEVDQMAAWTADDSPQVHSASSRPGSSAKRGSFSPARSERARGVFCDFLSHPNYMADTESHRAKIRSQSAPRQRVHFERPGSTRSFLRGSWDTDTCSEKCSSNFRNKASPGSGHMDRLRTPVQGGASSCNLPHGSRF